MHKAALPLAALQVYMLYFQIVRVIWAFKEISPSPQNTNNPLKVGFERKPAFSCKTGPPLEVKLARRIHRRKKIQHERCDRGRLVGDLNLLPLSTSVQNLLTSLIQKLKNSQESNEITLLITGLRKIAFF